MGIQNSVDGRNVLRRTVDAVKATGTKRGIVVFRATSGNGRRALCGKHIVLEGAKLGPAMTPIHWGTCDGCKDERLAALKGGGQ